MFHFLRHHYRLFLHTFRDFPLRQRRSSLWPRVEKEFLAEHSTCAACGGNKRLQAHHCKPFHLFPELELDKSNLLVLCMGRGKECHFVLGHSQNWQHFNPRVREDAAEALAHPERFDAIVKRARPN
jgi:5-methylcytosine-specific restriction protein A